MTNNPARNEKLAELEALEREQDERHERRMAELREELDAEALFVNGGGTAATTSMSSDRCGP